MKICVAQTKPVKGDFQANIVRHKKLISAAVSNGADTIIFPELSLTGYEPGLAQVLGTNQDDNRFNDFQKLSDDNLLTIGVGAPVKYDEGICISIILFQPNKARQTYSKKYIHPDEEEFFIAGQTFTGSPAHHPNIALAICYELSVPGHSHNAFKNGAKIYIASVAKSVNGVKNAIKTLSGIAKKYSMTVLMSNCVGLSGGEQCGGKTSIWNNEGALLGQLDEVNEGILVIDTASQEIIAETIK